MTLTAQSLGTDLFILPVQIFIFENNIYYRPAVDERTIRLVSTGEEGVVFNGLGDWLYEGEVTLLCYCTCPVDSP